MAISDRIAMMNAGQIVQIGSAEDLYRRPAARFVATFLGDANLVASRIVEAGTNRLTLSIEGTRWDIATRVRAPVGSNVEAVVRPEAIKLSDMNGGLRGRILSSTYLGARIEYAVQVGSQTLQVVQSDPAHGVRFADGVCGRCVAARCRRPCDPRMTIERSTQNICPSIIRRHHGKLTGITRQAP